MDGTHQDLLEVNHEVEKEVGETPLACAAHVVAN